MLTDEQRLNSHAEGGSEREIEGAGRYQPVFYVILAWVVQGLIRPQNGRLKLVGGGLGRFLDETIRRVMRRPSPLNESCQASEGERQYSGDGA